MCRDVPALSIDELQRLQYDYPYFQTAKFLYLKKLHNSFPERYPRALQEGALYASDRKSLFYLLESANQSWSNLYPEEKNVETRNSFDLIDSFLSSHSSETSSQESLYLGNIIREIPYSIEEIEQETAHSITESNNSSFDLVDAFLEKSAEEKKITIESTPDSIISTENNIEDTPDEEFLTESLAKIYIKQRRYSKALEIIRKLSLKYPEKNIYFADQIRFLEKLIINIKTE